MLSSSNFPLSLSVALSLCAMLPQSLSLSSHPSFLPKTHFSKPSFKQNPCLRIPIKPVKCSVSVVSEPIQLAKTKPLPAEVSRTVMELANSGTLSTLTREGWPLGFGVRFAVDGIGTPVLCLDRLVCDDKRCSLHVQLEQCGGRMLQCTIQGSLVEPGDRMALKKLNSVWNKRFGEEANETHIHTVSVERVLQIEDFAEDGVWVTSSEYASANPDPLRDFAEKFVDEINAHNREDVHRFCNIYADLGFQVLEAKMVWVDRLGFDVRVRSTQNDVFEVRIPFPREVSDEKGAKSSFNGMSQIAWEVEKNFHVPEFEKVTQLKKIMGNVL